MFSLAKSLWLLWDGSHASVLCSSRSCCNRPFLGTLCTLKQVVDPVLGHWRLSKFCFYSQRKEQFSNKASVLSRRDTMFQAKFPACYRQEGSSMTFCLRINTQPQQWVHGTPKLANVQSFFYPNKYQCFSFHFLFILPYTSYSSLQRINT